MDNVVHNSISIEKFAAYLDGNLSIEETQDIARMIMNDSTLSELLAINTVVDNQVQQMEERGYALPDDIANMEFGSPHLDETTEYSNLDDIETLQTHEEFSTESNNMFGTNNEDASFSLESDGLSSNAYYENFFSSSNDSIENTGMQQDFFE